MTHTPQPIPIGRLVTDLSDRALIVTAIEPAPSVPGQPRAPEIPGNASRLDHLDATNPQRVTWHRPDTPQFPITESAEMVALRVTGAVPIPPDCANRITTDFTESPPLARTRTRGEAQGAQEASHDDAAGRDTTHQQTTPRRPTQMSPRGSAARSESAPKPPDFAGSI